MCGTLEQSLQTDKYTKHLELVDLHFEIFFYWILIWKYHINEKSWIYFKKWGEPISQHLLHMSKNLTNFLELVVVDLHFFFLLDFDMKISYKWKEMNLFKEKEENHFRNSCCRRKNLNILFSFKKFGQRWNAYRFEMNNHLKSLQQSKVSAFTLSRPVAHVGSRAQTPYKRLNLLNESACLYYSFFSLLRIVGLYISIGFWDIGHVNHR